MLSSATAEPHTVPSEQLLKRLADNDAAAWTALLERFGAQILTVTRRILGDAALAEDAVQETLLLVRDHAGRFTVDSGDAEAAVRRWIVRIACTTALQMLRKSRQTAKREAQYMRLGSSTPSVPAAESAERAETAAQVQRELAQLPDDYRLPITLHILGGLTFQDVAAELRCPVGTAKTNVHRGLERLRKRLAVFGILLPLSELAEHLQRTGLPPAAPSVQQLAQWQTLLTSSAKPAYALAVAKGGLSFMAKSAIGLTAAALLTTAAVTITTARTAEQKPDAPPPAPAAAAQAGNAPPVTQAAGSSFEADPNDPEWVAALKKKFETKVTIEFVDTDFESVFAFIRQITNAPIIVLPDAAAHAPAVSINAKDESLAKALQRIIAMAKLEYSFTQGALVVGDAADLKLVQAAKLELSPALAEMLARKVTFEFEDQALSDGINFFGTLTKFKSEIDPAVAQKLVTLRGSKMPLRDAVLWSALLAGAEAADKKGVLVISPATHPIKIPAAGRAAPVVEPKAAPAPERKKDEF